jgi:hypothetical protein
MIQTWINYCERVILDTPPYRRAELRSAAGGCVRSTSFDGAQATSEASLVAFASLMQATS